MSFRLGDPGVMPEPSLDPPCDAVADREYERASDDWAANVKAFAGFLETAATGMTSAATWRDVDAFRKCYEAADLLMAKLEEMGKGFSIAE